MGFWMERRRKSRTRSWEVIDVELAQAFHATSTTDRDDWKKAIEMQGHRVIIKEFEQ